MNFLLDTNVVSAMRRKGRLERPALDWLQRQAIDDLHISVLTMMEIEAGIRLQERRDPVKAAMLRRWKEGPLTMEFAGRILAVDLEIAERCAALNVPATRPAVDALIAATAIVRRLTVVTRNVRDFEGTGVRIVNPWGEGA